MDILDLSRRVSSSAMFFATLFAIDEELAEREAARGCPVEGCGGPLHHARYRRKPRGERVELPEAYSIRQGLCCGWCRCRTLPPSCLFLGRRVYWGWAVMLATAAMQGGRRDGCDQVRDLLGVSARTLRRWLRWFAELFPSSRQWQRVRGVVGAEVSDAGLALEWLVWTARSSPSPQAALERCLGLLAGSGQAI